MQEIDIILLITEASITVKAVMVILFLSSILSWSIILKMIFLLKKNIIQIKEFRKQFWTGVNLNDLFKKIQMGQKQHLGIFCIFSAGYKELTKFNKNISPKQDITDNVNRTMHIVLSREINKMESSLPILASITSACPYIGLFGTVWGIMNSFIALGNVKQATLAMVAPGIAEALIATAMGLFAAIPALIAYNYFNNKVNQIVEYYNNFIEEFITIITRKLHHKD